MTEQVHSLLRTSDMDLDDFEYLDRIGDRFFEVGAVAQECEDPVPVLTPREAYVYFSGRPRLESAFLWSNHCARMADILPLKRGRIGLKQSKETQS